MAIFGAVLTGLLNNWKAVLFGLAALAVVTTIGLAYKHYTGLLDTVAVLQTNNAQLKTAVETQGQTIDAQQDAIEEWQASQDALVARVEELQRVARDASDEVRRLNGIFARHDLTELARRRPGLIENRINGGTAAVGRLLECATGAERPDCADRGDEAGGAPDAP